jgi:hypothetical protein
MFDLLELAENKAFAALSNEERQFVLAFMSEAAYQNLYETAARLRHADAAPTPPPALREAILRHLPAPKPWYRRSVPLATYLLIPDHASPSPTTPAPAKTVVQKTDTIYLEKVKYKTQIIEKQILIPVNIPIAQINTSTPQAADHHPQADPFPNVQVSDQAGAISTQPGLIQFFTPATKRSEK